MSANSNDPSDNPTNTPSTVAATNNDVSSSSSDFSSTSVTQSTPLNYLFLLILVGVVLIIILFLFLSHQRSLRHRQNRASGVHALAIDVERLAHHNSVTNAPVPPAIPRSGRWVFGRLGRYGGAGGSLGHGGGEEHIHNVVRHDEGLDEHGEAPPPYEPGSMGIGKPTVEVNRENLGVQTVRRGEVVDEPERENENGNRNGNGNGNVNTNANANANEMQSRMAEGGERPRSAQLPGYNEDPEELEEVVITPLARAIVSAGGRRVSVVDDMGEDDATRGRQRNG